RSSRLDYSLASSLSAAADGRTIASSFNLRVQALGAWDVIVINPDGRTETLPGGFAIEASTGAQLWVDVVAPSVVRPGSLQTLYVIYGNRGNVDSNVALLDIALPPPYQFVMVRRADGIILADAQTATDTRVL